MLYKIQKFQLGMKHRAEKVTAKKPLRSKGNIARNVTDHDIHKRNVEVPASGVRRQIIQVKDALISLRMTIILKKQIKPKRNLIRRKRKLRKQLCQH